MAGKTLFLAPFPDEKNIRDGMILRIESIDRLFQSESRTYLHISLRRNWKKHIETKSNAEIYRLNILLHLPLIWRIISHSDQIYLHSIIMMKHVFFILLFIKPKPIVLDAHGAVPEEESYLNRKLISFYYACLESFIFRHVSTVICVSHSMVRHFKAKYPDYTGRYLTYYILPNYLKQSELPAIPDTRLETINNKVVVIFSGGTAKWQNIELMLETIRKNQSPEIFYLILSGQPHIFRKRLKERNIPAENILVDSADPSLLHAYYKIADYGFILRDKNTVNQVANPTKLVDYLYFGIIPIVLSPDIGDYRDKGMEYVPLSDFNLNLPKPQGKSRKNMEIIKVMQKENASFGKSLIFPADE